MTSDRRAATRHPRVHVDVSRPNIARVYDCFLGGKDNFAADREFVRQALEIAPKAALGAKTCRVFLRRVVRYLTAEAGITQFLDIGSGLPTRGNVSEVAHEIDPAVRVMHVDNDPVVYMHSKALLADARTTDAVLGDVRDPAEILADPEVRAMIDFSRPVGLLLLAVLHHVEDDDDPAGITAQLRDAMPAGSYIAISSFRLPGPELPELRATTIQNEKLLASTPGSGRWRSDEELLGWFGDWELVEPGFASCAEWHAPRESHIPKDELYHSLYGGVARKTGPLKAR